MKIGLSLFVILLTSLVFSMNSDFRTVKEIDLSFFLRPHQPHGIFLTVDSQSNIFITQRGKEKFIKMDPKGELVYEAPSKIEGEIFNFDIDNDDNPVCAFTPRRKGGGFYFPIIWFDGTTGEKKREINLGETFDFVVHINILRPYDLILVNGTVGDPRYQDRTLHIMDFSGKILKSFSKIENLKTADIKKYSFAVRPEIDHINQRILLAFLPLERIAIYDYSGKLLDEMKWNKRRFLIYLGDLWLGDNKDYAIYKNVGHKYVQTKEKISAFEGYFLASDLLGKLYYVAGKEFQYVKIYNQKE